MILPQFAPADDSAPTLSPTTAEVAVVATNALTPEALFSGTDEINTAVANVYVTRTAGAQANASATANVLTMTADAATDTPTPDIAATALMRVQTQDALDLLQAALERARNFSGGNEDWLPFEWDFDGVTMVLVPAGCFQMGNDPEGRYWDGSGLVTGVPDGGRQCFNMPFWIDKVEVTNAQFAAFEGTVANGSGFSGDQRPRENITWFEARDFCARRGARLPTEAEWEYAARGVTAWKFPWGDSWDETKAVWNRSSSEGTADVGSIAAGASWVGALDMIGNVWEWVNSLADPYPYDASDGREADTGERTDVWRVLRGGSWFNYDSDFLRSAARIDYFPVNFGNYYDFGFRCVRSF
jgi:formylglycine-generating enzyme required for sulfatase activity